MLQQGILNQNPDTYNRSVTVIIVYLLVETIGGLTTPAVVTYKLYSLDSRCD